MGGDEQLQLQKDTLWEIHETGKLIACLERKLETQMEAIEAVHNAWKEKRLIVAAGQLSRNAAIDLKTNPVTGSALSLPDPAAVKETVRGLQDAREKKDKLQSTFDMM